VLAIAFVGLFLIMECKFQICVELYLYKCGQIGVKSQHPYKSRGTFAWSNLSFVNISNIVTWCSRSRGKMRLHFQKVRVKMHRQRKWG
jgi:hypothetical protein